MSGLFILQSLAKSQSRLLWTSNIRYITRFAMHTGNVSRQQAKEPGDSKHTLQTRSEEHSGNVSTDVLPLGKRIQEDATTTFYWGVVLAGFGLTGVVFYFLGLELFSNDSAQNIYSKALKRVVNDTRVQDSLGPPLRGYGESDSRRRRHHIAHSRFLVNDVEHVRLRFYVEGSRNKGTVHLETQKNANGDLEYRYFFVQLNNYPHTVIIFEDNRNKAALLDNNDLLQ